jgi:adenine-specific DNA-methyltransferase
MSELKKLLAEVDKLKKQLAIANNRIKTANYGIAWMDVPEAFEDDSENKLPILEEVKETAILNDDNYPTHLLIEGDNYHSLSCLNYTHRESVDLIYIDPPYNTGKDGFIYRDKRIIDKFPDGTPVPLDSPFRHSYWLSFMYKRLDLARGLLKDTGKIVISIDDNELANLVLVCSKVFGNSNQVAILPTVMNLKGNQDQFGFAGTHEYTVIFAKDITKCSFNQFDLDESELEKWEEDEIGPYKKGATLKATGEDAPRAKRPKMFYPILVHKKSLEIQCITDAEHASLYTKETKTFHDDQLAKLKAKYEAKGFHFILPTDDSGNYTRWRWGWKPENKRRLLTDVIVTEPRGGISLYKKQRPELNELPSKKPKTLFYKPEYSSGNGTNQLKSIVPGNKFKAPKPVDLIKDLVKICATEDDSIILDFFAGSGTTLQAILELNADLQKNYQGIICTNNEGGICENVTYPRVQKVISGYKNNKGLKVEGTSGSMRHYRTEFVANNNILDTTDEDKTELALKAGYLLALAENTLEKLDQNDYYQFFQNNGKTTGIYYREELDEMEDFIERIEKIDGTVSVYLFSWGTRSEFESLFDHLPNVSIKTIPLPILEIYKKIYNLL